MKKTDKISYRQKSTEELLKNLLDLRKKFIETKAKSATGNQKDTSVFSKIKYEISLISTLIQEKKNDKQN
jgi:ribosomal protein L29